MFTLMMRRFMMRIAGQVSRRRQGCEALITGESLGPGGQPDAGRACACTDAVADMPVFRPLIGNG